VSFIGHSFKVLKVEVNMMKVVNNGGEVIEVTETAFNVLYKDRGFVPYEEKKTASSATKKKVKADDSKSR
jgi:hypothetical protein